MSVEIETLARRLGAEAERIEPRAGGSVLDAVDLLVDRGALVQGNVVLGIADVDLVVLNLGILLSAVETIDQAAARRGLEVRAGSPARPPGVAAGETAAGAREGGREARPVRSPGERIELDPRAAEKGVARLVLTLVEFVRRLLERQAIRRMDGGLLDERSVERMGVALARLEEKVGELRRIFGLEGEELDLDLGPLGRLNGPGLPGPGS